MARCACSGAQCDQVRDCLSAGPGAVYDPDTGVIEADVSVWPFTCPMANGSGIYADSGAGGVLRGEPMPKATVSVIEFDTNYPSLAVPAAPTTVAAFPVDVTNPDPCRQALLVIARQVDVFFTLPANSGAASLSQGDEITYVANNGATSMTGVHTNICKVNHFTMPPGSTLSFSNNVGVSRGSGSAVYTRIQADFRAWLFTLPS